MAQQNSFDIVSDIDMQEVDNAFNQAMKELSTRYDFRGSKSAMELKRKEKEIVILADDDFKRKALIDILATRLIKRGISIKALVYGSIEEATHGMIRQTISLQSGIDKENAKKIVKMIKDTKLKVQATIMEDQVRVNGKDKDDLQRIIQMLKDADLPFAMQFINYR